MPIRTTSRRKLSSGVGDWGLYSLFVAMVLGVVWCSRPTEEERLPERAAVPWPTVDVSGLVVQSDATRLGFTAVRATPRSSGGVITLGGWREGLDLTDVQVELGPQTVLRGSAGTLVDDQLRLTGEVTVDREGTRCVDARTVEIRGKRIRFPGIVVFYRTGRRATEMNIEMTDDELIRRVRR